MATLAQHFETKAVKGEGLTGIGDHTCLVDHESGQCGIFVIRKVPVESAVEIADWYGPINCERAVGMPAHAACHGIMFVNDLADDLFENVFERDEAHHLAILIDNQREVRLAP